eukprot:s1327_g26.t1
MVKLVKSSNHWLPLRRAQRSYTTNKLQQAVVQCVFYSRIRNGSHNPKQMSSLGPLERVVVLLLELSPSGHQMNGSTSSLLRHTSQGDQLLFQQELVLSTRRHLALSTHQ